MLSDTHAIIKKYFSTGSDNICIPELSLRIHFAPFSSDTIPSCENRKMLASMRGSTVAEDNTIPENKQFVYPVFMPYDRLISDRAIILLHGLNERKWDKYFTWAHFLAKETGKAVILFPISFHLNRGKQEWMDPHQMNRLVEERKSKFPNIEASTFINLALSERLTQSPERFFLAGLQTICDLYELIDNIRSGKHPMFEKNTKIDFFAYSIGGLIAQVMMIADQEGIISESRFFFFAAGSAFGDMNGTSRLIMDSKANERTVHYYTKELETEMRKKGIFHDFFEGTALGRAFRSMISLDQFAALRNQAFRRFNDKIRGIALEDDKVIPADKIIQAFTDNGQIPKGAIEVVHFPFAYSHELPFPLKSELVTTQVEEAFQHVFRSAASFLA
ncbi:MAG: DUF6051 family protein [Bacteroidales bacterium]